MDYEAIFVLIGLFILGSLVALVVLPIIALVRSRHIGTLIERVQDLEIEVRQLKAARSGAQTPRESAADVLEIPIETKSVAEPGPEALELPKMVPAESARPASAEIPAHPGAEAIEAWIGRRGLGWAAVALLLFATAFFLKHAFESNWIGPLGRVSIGLMAGAILCLTGWRYHLRGWRLFSQMLSAGGIVLLYLATFGAFGYYHLIPRSEAAVFLIVLIAETAALAVLYDAPAIALMAVIGGLLNPILLSTGIDQYRSLFLYLIALNAGVVGLAVARSWHAVGTVALLGTQCLFWGWYGEHYHPEKMMAAIGFQVTIFSLYLAYPLRRSATDASWLHSLIHRQADIEDLVRLMLNALLVALAGYTLLDDDYHVWMGTLAVGMAIIYTARSWLVLRIQPDDVRHILVATATGLAFLAMVFPLQAEAAWIGLGWAVLGLALWWFGLRIESDALRIFGAVWLVLAVGRLVLIDTPWQGRTPFLPVFNKYALPALAIAACVSATAVVSRRLGRDGAERTGRLLTGLAGVVLVWLVMSVDTYQYFTARIGRSRLEPTTLVRLAQVGLSVLWAVFAALLLMVGFRLPSRPLRWLALGLFGLTMIKVILLDMAGLSGFYRVTAFFVLSMMMGAAAWGYQKIEAIPREPKTSEGPHETV